MRTLSRRSLLGGLTLALVPVTSGTGPTASASPAPPSTSLPSTSLPTTSRPALLAAPRSAGPLRLELPRPTGPLPVGTTELHLVDHTRPDPLVAGRARELMVSVWYPARPGRRHPLAPYMRPHAAAAFATRTEAELGLAPGQVDWRGITTHAASEAPVRTGSGGHPVVLFSPGRGVPRTLGTLLVEELASRGYVVVTIDHTFEANEVEFPFGRVEKLQVPAIDPTELNRLLIRMRVQDTRFVLDQLAVLAAGGNPDAEGRLLPAGLHHALDLSRIGMFGHSAGGFTTGETMLVDRRVDAGANLDGSMAYSFSRGEFGQVVERGLDRPFLLMGAGLSDGAPHTHLGAVDWGRFWERSTGWKLDLHVPEGEHMTFTDHEPLLPRLAAAFDLPEALVTSTLGTVDPARVVASLRAYLLAFFDQHLRHRRQRLLEGPSPRHPDVTFVR
jgi:predicted dienelactone hydrolase